MKKIQKIMDWIKGSRIFKLRISKYVKTCLLIGIGLFAGWLFFHSARTEQVDSHGHETVTPSEEIWTCAMHPQIRMHEPGKCPICGMELIPLSKAGETLNPMAVMLSKEAIALANVNTSVVSRQMPTREVRLYGKVQPDERLFQSQPAHIPGRIEELDVNFTGETVKKGQTLVKIYSPELIKAQQDLLEAAKMKDLQPAILEAARERLRQWKLTDDQIASIEKSGEIAMVFPVVAGTSGVVMARRVNVGDYVSRGTTLLEIADLSKLWVLFDAYEQDLPFIRNGDKITYTLQAMPGKTFTGSVSFVDPFVDPSTRVAKVRVEVSNSNGQLKPEMFATGQINARLDQYRNNLVIPRSAVLWTGKRSVVYVRLANEKEPTFQMREITLGPLLGNSYVVADGLADGEEIVTEGTFSIDAAAQLEGKPSMMNPKGGKTNTMPDMDMSGDDRSDKINVSMDFVMQLNSVFDQYIVLKDALVQSDAKKAKLAAQKVGQLLGKVDMKLLTGDARKKWMDLSGQMDKQIKQMESSDNLRDQRKAFYGFSEPFYKAIKTFGLMGKTAYYQYCPMAFGSRGAYWLSESDKIRNPYFGEAMLKCGETRETLK
ncbi:MAG: efflux RND transporter periplasmic adaptor subunit [Bacteroidetes bacterium]|nr:MAG: efflux RND transporter periplasmic adaptor subunit [Bacteroidota bacterium]